jgi:hypothetical protein
MFAAAVRLTADKELEPLQLGRKEKQATRSTDAFCSRRNPIVLSSEKSSLALV